MHPKKPHTPCSSIGVRLKTQQKSDLRLFPGRPSLFCGPLCTGIAPPVATTDSRPAAKLVRGMCSVMPCRLNNPKKTRRLLFFSPTPSPSLGPQRAESLLLFLDIWPPPPQFPRRRPGPGNPRPSTALRPHPGACKLKIRPAPPPWEPRSPSTTRCASFSFCARKPPVFHPPTRANQQNPGNPPSHPPEAPNARF
jgi:hypothetical protein